MSLAYICHFRNELYAAAKLTHVLPNYVGRPTSACFYYNNSFTVRQVMRYNTKVYERELLDIYKVRNVFQCSVLINNQVRIFVQVTAKHPSLDEETAEKLPMSKFIADGGVLYYEGMYVLDIAHSNFVTEVSTNYIGITVIDQNGAISRKSVLASLPYEDMKTNDDLISRKDRAEVCNSFSF